MHREKFYQLHTETILLNRQLTNTITRLNSAGLYFLFPLFFYDQKYLISQSVYNNNRKYVSPLTFLHWFYIQVTIHINLTGPRSFPQTHPVTSVHGCLLMVTVDLIPFSGGGKIFLPLSEFKYVWKVLVLYACKEFKK